MKVPKFAMALVPSIALGACAPDTEIVAVARTPNDGEIGLTRAGSIYELNVWKNDGILQYFDADGLLDARTNPYGFRVDEFCLYDRKGTKIECIDSGAALTGAQKNADTYLGKLKEGSEAQRKERLDRLNEMQSLSQ